MPSAADRLAALRAAVMSPLSMTDKSAIMSLVTEACRKDGSADPLDVLVRVMARYAKKPGGEQSEWGGERPSTRSRKVQL